MEFGCDLLGRSDWDEVPGRRQQVAEPWLNESWIDQKQGSAVGLGSDDASCGLDDPIDARVDVGEFEPGPLGALEMVADDIPFEADLRESDADDDGTGEPIADEVDTFAEYPAEQGEPQSSACRAGSKTT